MRNAYGMGAVHDGSQHASLLEMEDEA